jgi:uncharacterized membrane protein YoaT (DUF817 family)
VQHRATLLQLVLEPPLWVVLVLGAVIVVNQLLHHHWMSAWGWAAANVMLRSADYWRERAQRAEFAVRQAP